MSSPPAPINLAPSLPTLKLLVDKKANRVLYAEAGKEAVDFFFSLLAMPIGTVAKVLQTGSDGVGVANIYDSVEKMDTRYMHSKIVQKALLSSCRPLFLERPITTHPAAPSMRASVHGATSYPLQYASVTAHALAPTGMAADVARDSSLYGSIIAGGGHVQGLVTYTIMDDLTITPMSNISAVVLITKLNREQKDLMLEEKSVKIGNKEAFDILKASMNSNTVLTDAFLSDNNTDVSLSKNKRARTSSGEKKQDNIPDLYI
ncbi:hypothetical protein CFC21_039346 [Triticum aestivum]|uniref:Uncharacterized protein n=2 Tax=Triticum aestivum TaxID=4565 RepID=A0A077S3X2_WHEAT|nr:hypothetical protein CFC21_039346 [Triticum aestivum]CDM80790.1 unnamed protein product [Triticum aestivum]CDM84306.1 unnamed protein product [Triticum aestivum]